MKRDLRPVLSCVAVLVGFAATNAQAQCSSSWTSDLTSAALSNARAAVVFNDGTGDALYVADGGRVFKRSGSAWVQVGANFLPSLTAPAGQGTVTSLAVFNGQLYAAGEFKRVGTTGVSASNIASNVARWNAAASRWEGFGAGTTSGTSPTRGITGAVTMGSTVTLPRVNAMYVLDEDGPGGPGAAALYCAGVFLNAGGASVRGIAKWTGVGTAWTAMGTGHTDIAYALGEYDADGEGPNPARLVIGGRFDSMGSQPANINTSRIAFWDGAAWVSIGGGFPGLDGFVDSLTSFDPDGAGPNLPHLATGCSSFASFPRLNVFDGASWAANTPTTGSADEKFVQCLGVQPSPTGDTLFAGLNDAANLPNNRYVARWTSTGGWSIADGTFEGNICLQTGGSTAIPRFISMLDTDGSGADPSRLVVLGTFRKAGQAVASGIVALDSNTDTWMPVLPGNGSVDFPGSMVEFDDDGAGPNAPSVHIVCSGSIGNALGSPVARWTGSGWVSVGNCATVQPSDVLCAATESGAPRLFLGGSQGGALGVGTLKALRSGVWENVVGPLGETAFAVGDIAGSDPDGTGPLPRVVYAAVYFTNGLGNEAARVLRYDGAAWTTLPGEFTFTDGGGVPGAVSLSLTPLDTGVGEVLHASGRFTHVDATSVRAIARFDGAAWQPMGPGLPDQVNRCRPAVVTVGNATDIYIGGTFGTVAGAAAVLKWTGTDWTPNPGDGTGTFSDWAAITGIRDGSANVLVAIGPPTIVDGVTLTSPRIAKFDGTAWSSFTGGGFSSVGSFVNTLTTGSGTSKSLWVSGVSGINPASSGIARYDFFPCAADFNCDQIVSVNDIFDFLNAWFAGCTGQSGTPCNGRNADVDGIAGLAVGDIFAFLNLWFAGCE